VKLPSFIEQLHALISLPSVSSSTPGRDMGNRAVIDLLASWLEQAGFAVEIMPVTPCGHKANLIATKGTGSGGLVLAGHTDTVPFDENLWSVNPLALTEKDNRYYGLGVCDMKGFFPLAIAAAQLFADQMPMAPLIILATADEESSMNGARILVEQGKPKARFAVIGEPTGLKPVRMHKGVMLESVRITGHSGHSSNPALGASALDAMAVALNELTALRSEWQQRYRNAQFSVDVPTMNFGYINGGDNPNRICGCCELQFDVRPMPGMVIADLQAEIDSRLQRVDTLDGRITVERIPLMQAILPFEENEDGELVRALEKLTGYAAESTAFGTEAPFLQQLGMQTVIYGPGDIAQAHQPDEFLALERIQPTIDVLAALIGRYCFSRG
jgi:acetylornithine deacetylase